MSKEDDGDWVARRHQGEGNVVAARDSWDQKPRGDFFPDRQDLNLQGDRGKRCELDGCGQLDFLPTQCHLCKKQFCQMHSNDHGCDRGDGRRLPVCKVCNKAVMLKAGEDYDTAMSIHLDSKCKARLRVAVDAAREAESRCDYGKGRKACKDNFPVKLKCSKCLKQFCVKHREPSVHKCKGLPAKPSAGPKEAAQQVPQSSHTGIIRTLSKEAMERDIRRLKRERTPSPQRPREPPDVEMIWACPVCTFHNKKATTACAICGTGRGAAPLSPAE